MHVFGWSTWAWNTIVTPSSWKRRHISLEKEETLLTGWKDIDLCTYLLWMHWNIIVDAKCGYDLLQKHATSQSSDSSQFVL